MSRRKDFERAYPDGTFLDPEDREELARYALSRGFLASGERLETVSRAGEGNMNLTLRLKTDRRSLILKQARPWVEKYPAIAAPPGRARVELAFYVEAARRPRLARAMPRLVGSDASSGVIALQDLGDAQDFTFLYGQGQLAAGELDTLVAILSELHRPMTGLSEKRRAVFQNREMRALNHEHIFRLPLAKDNGLDLDGLAPGLAASARKLQDDDRYVEAVSELGRLYLVDGDVLVHGDYFPGSWLRAGAGIRVIDPEFCFLGTPAFDVGVLLGHLYLARQPRKLGERLLDRYPSGPDADGDELARRARGFAGVEIMRRLIGVAQLPIAYDTEARSALLETSRELVLS